MESDMSPTCSPGFRGGSEAVATGGSQVSAGKEGPALVSMGKTREATARGTDALRRLAALIDAGDPDARGVLEALEAEAGRRDGVNPDDPDGRILNAGTLAGLGARLNGTTWTVGDLLNRFGDVDAVDSSSFEVSRIRRAQWDAPHALDRRWVEEGVPDDCPTCGGCETHCPIRDNGNPNWRLCYHAN